jgi:hypothetical protein
MSVYRPSLSPKEARRQRRADASSALADLKRHTAELLRYGRDVIGLPVAAETLLRAAARGKTVDEAAFARALELARQLADKLGWEALHALGEAIRSGRP